MGRATGIRCDGCDKFVALPNDQLNPPGWILVSLPHSPAARPEDYKRDICSDACAERFFKERRRANGSLSGDEAKTELPIVVRRAPASRPSAKTVNIMDNGTRTTLEPDLYNFLNNRGITAEQRGPLMTSHVRGRHEGDPKPGCLICEYATRQENT